MVSVSRSSSRPKTRTPRKDTRSSRTTKASKSNTSKAIKNLKKDRFEKTSLSSSKNHVTDSQKKAEARFVKSELSKQRSIGHPTTQPKPSDDFSQANPTRTSPNSTQATHNQPLNTSGQTSSPLENWDPRLQVNTGVISTPQNPSIGYEPAQTQPGEPHLQAAQVRYESDQVINGVQESGGRHHIYATAPEGATVYTTNSAGEKIPFTEKYEDRNGDGSPERYHELPMWGGDKYKVHVEHNGMKSDAVTGLHMPANHHVNYQVDFQIANQPANPGSQTASTNPQQPVEPTTPTQDTQAQAPQNQAPLEDLVHKAYQEVLQREPYSGEGPAVQNWSNFANGLRQQGKTDQEISQALATEFQKSEEYQSKFGTHSAPTTPEAPPEGNPPIEGPQPTQPGTSPSPSQGNGYLNAQGQPENFIGANYTDIGREAIQAPTSPAFRAEVAKDLERLQQQGVESVRVWANPPSTYPDNDVARMSARVDVIAQEAAKRGMRISVDLIDSFGSKDINNYQGGELGQQLDQRIQSVVGPNGKHDNIDWSVGNEIGDPANPMAFANWYADKASQIRQTSRNPNQRIISELTPGALGHPDHGWPQAREAMQKVVDASDIVNVHFYPVGSPGNLSGPRPDGTWPAADWDSLKSWHQMAEQAGKPFVVGEFGIPRDAEPVSQEAYIQQTGQWLQELHNLGADQVRFWQFLKDDVGHTDPAAVDFHHPEMQGLLDHLHQDGWLHRKPA